MLKEYQTVEMDEYQKDRADRLNGEIEQVAHKIQSGNYPMHPRYLALALTHLETAAMFAKKAVTHNKFSPPPRP
jgi:hypothetical protein